MKTKWKNWLKAAGVRAVKTVAQTAVATIGTSAVLGEVDWIVVASASALAGVLSLLTSVAGLPELPDTDGDGFPFLSTPSGWRATAKTDKVFVCFCAKGRRICLFKTRKEKNLPVAF